MNYKQQVLKKDLQLLRRQDKHNSDAPHIICEVKEWQIQEKTAGGYVLRTGESQRKDGRYSYTALDKNRRTVYAKTLVELRAKERKSSVTKKMD